MSLTDARELANKARDRLKRGIDPIDTRRAERKAEWYAAMKARGQARAAATTLRNYAKVYHEKREARRAGANVQARPAVDQQHRALSFTL